MRKLRMFFFIATAGLCGCAGSFYEAQTRDNAMEVTINGSVIRVIDLGPSKVEMIRKGYIISGAETERWEDFQIAGKQVTGCDIYNIIPRPGTTGTTWVQALKRCPTTSQ